MYDLFSLFECLLSKHYVKISLFSLKHKGIIVIVNCFGNDVNAIFGKIMMVMIIIRSVVNKAIGKL